MLTTVPQNIVITESGDCLPVMYYNNLGCNNFHTRKHHSGAFYFRRAVEENENAFKSVKKSSEEGGNTLHFFHYYSTWLIFKKLF